MSALTLGTVPRLANRVFLSVLVILCFAVAGYALSVAARPQLSPLAAQLVAARPWIALSHFGAGGVALAVGVLQLFAQVRRRRPALHRWLGRLYVLAVAISGSAGLFMATQTTAGRVAACGFAALAVLWLWTTLHAYRAIRARQVQRHRIWMLRSFALTLAAVTLRIYLPLSQLAGVSFDAAYAAIAWLCWVPNLLLAEYLRRRGVVPD
jgi:uncharacterized membrane protein